MSPNEALDLEIFNHGTVDGVYSPGVKGNLQLLRQG